MASFVWTTVFCLLVLELLVTFVLVVPVPRKYRNALSKRIFQLNLGSRLSKPILFIGIGLCLALIESYMTQQRYVARLTDGVDFVEGGLHVHSSNDHVYRIHDKERKYKAERNLYLAGFALTLLFVIHRITQLMQESVELETETEDLHQVVKDISQSQAASSHAVEVVTKPKPVQDKKVD